MKSLISVISIAKNENDLKDLKETLSRQTFKNFEFISSTKGTIPEAWNDAISRATGEFLVFTESDAMPLNEFWLEEISNHLKKGVVIKGLEIMPTNLNMCNLVGDASIFKGNKFDETFPVCEDSELFSRLRKKGIKIDQFNGFPVIHTPSISWKKTLSRAFVYGKLHMKILYQYGLENIDNINTQKLNRSKINPISNRIRIIAENILFLFGLLFGSIYYLPQLIKIYFKRF